MQIIKKIKPANVVDKDSMFHIICCVVNYVGFTSEKLIHKGFF